jgi:hypothetical protein
MASILLTLPDGSELLLPRSDCAIVQAEQTKQLLGYDVIQITISSDNAIELPIGTIFVFGGEEYTLNLVSKVHKKSSFDYVYDLLFEATFYDLIRAPFLDVDATGNYFGSEFDLMGDLSHYAGVVVNAANLQFGNGKWILGDVADSETKPLSFSNVSTLEALQYICNEFEVEFYVDQLPSNVRRINIKKIGSLVNIPFEYGKGYGAKSLMRSAVSDSRIVNKVYPYGSNENLPAGYRGNSPNLRIGNPGNDFLTNEESIESFGIHGTTKTFDHIKPERIGSITELTTDPYEFIDDTMDFNLTEKIGENTTYLIADRSAKITFQTGGLAGKQFELSAYDHATKKFKLIPFTDNAGLVTPGPEPFVLHFGDKYVISDIYMPETYVTAAEAKLRTEAQIYLDANKYPMVTYSLEVDEDYIRDLIGNTETQLFKVGDSIPVKDEELGFEKYIRITQLVRDVLDPSKYTIQLADSYDVNYIRRADQVRQEVKTIIRRNDLRNPIRARANYRTQQELLGMIFDADGYFTDKIKPGSIETLMLSVGAKSQQFILNLVMEPNYAGQTNAVLINQGSLVHYTIEPTIRTWYIPEATVALGTDEAYYIYARCNRNTEDATILFETAQIKVDQEGGYYHFLLGVLHSVDPTLLVRFISLTYGSTTINGRFIKTGVIMSGDERVWFDLDAGEIGGRITFRTAEGEDKAVADIYQEQREFVDLVTERLGENDGVIETWFYDGVPTLSNQPAINWTTIPVKDEHLNDLYYDQITGKSYRFVKNGGVYSWSLVVNSDLEAALALAAQAKDTADGKRRVFVTTPFPPYDVGDLWSNGTDLMICIVAKASGPWVSSDWDLATNYDNTKTTIDGGVVTSGRIQLVGEDGQIKAGITGGGTNDAAIRFWAGTSFANRDVAPFRVNQGGEVSARRRIEVMNESNVGQAGICGADTAGDGEVRMWAGSNYSGRNTAPFRVLSNGEMISTAGRIGSWKIDANGITNDSGTAYIIFRSSLAADRNEVMIGTNVFPATSGAASVAVFRTTAANAGENYAGVFYAKNGSLNWALYAFDGISFLGQTLINGKKHYAANMANQFVSLDPTMYDMISVYPTSGTCYVEFLAAGSRRFLIGEGKEIVIINRNDAFSNFYLKNIVIGFPEFYLLGGKVVTIIYSQGNWYVKSERDNDF